MTESLTNEGMQPPTRVHRPLRLPRIHATFWKVESKKKKKRERLDKSMWWVFKPEKSGTEAVVFFFDSLYF